MKKIIAVLTMFICLMAILPSCSKLKKAVPSGDKVISQGKSSNQEKSGNITPNPTVEPTPSPTATPTPDAQSSQKEQQTVASKKLTASKYVILVDISDQKVYVYKDGVVIRSMICSTGLPGTDTETPVGNFKINKYRGTFFYNSDPDVEEGAKYWVGFIGANFLFHSVPTDKDGNIIQEEADKLGTPASHGCVRLSMDDAKWFYQTIPTGSNVIIQQ